MLIKLITIEVQILIAINKWVLVSEDSAIYLIVVPDKDRNCDNSDSDKFVHTKGVTSD